MFLTQFPPKASHNFSPPKWNDWYYAVNWRTIGLSMRRGYNLQPPSQQQKCSYLLELLITAIYEDIGVLYICLDVCGTAPWLSCVGTSNLEVTMKQCKWQLRCTTLHKGGVECINPLYLMFIFTSCFWLIQSACSSARLVLPLFNRVCCDFKTDHALYSPPSSHPFNKLVSSIIAELFSSTISSSHHHPGLSLLRAPFLTQLFPLSSAPPFRVQPPFLIQPFLL